MEEWWSSLGLFMQSVWCITLFASLVFVIQTIMTFIGMDTDGGMDVDVSGIQRLMGIAVLSSYLLFVTSSISYWGSVGRSSLLKKR